MISDDNKIAYATTEQFPEALRQQRCADHDEPGSEQCHLCVDLTAAADRIAELERGYIVTGIEASPCPGCTYENGVFVSHCALHARIANLEAERDALLVELDSRAPKGIGRILTRFLYPYVRRVTR